MNKLNTLSDFFDQTQLQYRIIDLGQRLQKIDKHLFQRFEQCEVRYPTPFMRHAWFAVMFWEKRPLPEVEPVIWFLKLPLDELGQLQPAARDHLLKQLLQQTQLTGQTESGPQQAVLERDALKDNPYSFTPSQEKMAMFHGQSAIWLQRPPSQFYQDVRRYMSGDLGWDHWQHLGLQGMADFAARLDQDNNLSLLSAALPHLPAPAFDFLAQCLEHIDVPRNLVDQLLNTLPSPEGAIGLSSWLRAIASQANQPQVQAAILHQLAQGVDVEALALLSARLQPAMVHDELRLLYLEQLALLDKESFVNLLAELLFQPQYRQLLMNSFRQPNRSPALVEKLDWLFGKPTAQDTTQH